MEIQELRVGNLLFDKKDQICKVEKLTNDIEECGIYAIDSAITYSPIKGIPLSEEILLRCGFAWNIGKSAMWNKHEFLIGKDDDGFYFAQWQYDSNEDPYPSHIVHVNTLHDLQNLHKLITGQELNTSGLGLGCMGLCALFPNRTGKNN